MISEEEARDRILQAIEPLAAREVPLAEALGCYCAQDYAARVALPAFDNSAMDGYAVVASAPGQRLRVTGEQPAGLDRKLRVAPGEAVRIFTGAPIPEGADAIVMQEDVTREGDEIVTREPVRAGDFIRRQACDLAEGQTIVRRGERIRPATAALLASQGFASARVGGSVDAAIISTGDEVVSLKEKAKPGQIYDSNSVLLDGLVRQTGAAVARAEHCRDDQGSLRDVIERASRHRVIIITGGVSVGEHDLVQGAVRALGGKIEIWRVAVKPGKPFLFSRLRDSSVFGLPGNPVSAFVTFLKFVRPALIKMMGGSDLQLRQIPVRLTVDLRNDGDRVHYFRGRCDGGEFAPVGRQESHALFGLSQANALVRVEAGENLNAGTPVLAEVWD